ncbi:MAG: GTPase Era [Rhodothermales bacterium]|nr:GTPase Era [Rhodothermales bacterium]
MDPSPTSPESADPGGASVHRSGYVAIVGKPNAGKSTLLNALLELRLSIVTAKPQTTRHRVLGILSGPEYQVIFLDTPGVIKPRYGLQESMMRSVRRAIVDADLVLFIADVTRESPDTLSLEELAETPAVLVLNKMDLIKKDDALPLVERYVALRSFVDVVPVSARKNTNLDVLLQVIVDHLPPGPPYYPADVVSEHPERFFVAEIIREQVFRKFGQEIPYSAQVNIVSYDEKSDSGRDIIDAEIIVERDSQKAILIGRGGAAIKEVGMRARKSIERFLDRPVYLKLFVKVRKGWRDNEGQLRSFGYE